MSFAKSDVLFPSARSEEHTSELQSQSNLVCRLLLEKKKKHRQDARYSDSTHPLKPRCANISCRDVQAGLDTSQRGEIQGCMPCYDHPVSRVNRYLA